MAVAEGKKVDFYGDEDLERFTPDALRAAYDLLVFPGHTEYMTTASLRRVVGYRDRGGNLMFLSANNFFRRIVAAGTMLNLIDEWRDLGRPEAALCGVQYLANDRGRRQQPYMVVGAESCLGIRGHRRCRTAPDSASTGSRSTPGAGVAAERPGARPDPEPLRPGPHGGDDVLRAPSGAKVFSAGVLNFGGQVGLWPEPARILDNVWRRLGPPPVPPAGPPPDFGSRIPDNGHSLLERG